MILDSLGLDPDLALELDSESLNDLVERAYRLKRAEQATALSLQSLAAQGSGKQIQKTVKQLAAVKGANDGKAFVRAMKQR